MKRVMLLVVLAGVAISMSACGGKDFFDMDETSDCINGVLKCKELFDKNAENEKFIDQFKSLDPPANTNPVTVQPVE